MKHTVSANREALVSAWYLHPGPSGQCVSSGVTECIRAINSAGWWTNTTGGVSSSADSLARLACTSIPRMSTRPSRTQFTATGHRLECCEEMLGRHAPLWSTVPLT